MSGTLARQTIVMTMIPHTKPDHPTSHLTPVRGKIANVIGVLSAACLIAPASGAKITFAEVGAAHGLLPHLTGEGYGCGAAIADFDADGDLDLFVANAEGSADQLYENTDGTFTNIAATAGVGTLAASRTALWLDFDGDADLDLVVIGDCIGNDDVCGKTRLTLRFFRQNEAGTFDDATSAMGVADDGVVDAGAHRSGAAAGDLNNDGWPDIVVGLWQGPALVLLNAAGEGFVDISAVSGIATAAFFHWQPIMHDFNRDGWLDIYWNTDFEENRLWLNQGDLTFIDVAPALGVDNAMNDMGVALGDYDADGDFDLYLTEIHEFENHNILYRNDTVDGTLAFTEVSEEAGVADTDFGWGTTFFDADNDGFLDLAATNGWFSGIGFADRTRFFHQSPDAPGTFVERGVEVGLDDELWGVALLAFDLERDGDLDLLQTTNLDAGLRLLENTTTAPGNFLVVRPRMPGPNSHALGAEIYAEIETADGARLLSRHITAGTSHLGQEPAEAFFGTGDAPVVDHLRIRWPDGAQTVRRNVPINQTLTIERSRCAGTVDLDGDGDVDVTDLIMLLAEWGDCAVACPQDVDASGAVDVGDLIGLLARWGACR